MDRILALESEKSTLETNVEEKAVVVAQNSEELETQKRQCKNLNEELDDARRKMRKLQDEHEDETKTNQRKIENLEYSKGALERQNKSLEDELNAKQAHLALFQELNHVLWWWFGTQNVAAVTSHSRDHSITGHNHGHRNLNYICQWLFEMKRAMPSSPLGSPL